MELEKLARTILFGTRWEDKLVYDEGFEDSPRVPPLQEAPRFPGRPHSLSRIGKAEFPALSRLVEDSTRGRVLHFFANHELLAMELMALMLLKFPAAPKEFRAGVARTIREEQEHLKLYVARMHELGVGFGDLPVSDYFWNLMKDMASPLEFVVQMSLTLEQANLDFSLHYQKAVADAGDTPTASILERVYREEIGHVKHGLAWFNRWRADGRTGAESEDDWDAYLRLLPPPMTPRRARGEHIFAADGRRQAGFSERFIRELERYSGSKGRPPVLWFYNPGCEAEIAHGRPGYSPSRRVERLTLDLEHVPMYLARESDVVFVRELPRGEWLDSLHEAGFQVPVFRAVANPERAVHEKWIGGIEPWGWSPEAFGKFKFLKDRLSAPDGSNGSWCRGFLDQSSYGESNPGEIFSKSWSTKYLGEWLDANPRLERVFGSRGKTGRVFREWRDAFDYARRALSDGEALVAKAPWGTSGTRNKRILDANELDSAIGGWIRRVIDVQGAIVLEPWLDKLADLSMQIEIGPDTLKVLGIRQFLTGARMEFRGTWLDPKLRGLPGEALRFLHSEDEPLEQWKRLAGDLSNTLRDRGYQGPAGLDAMVFRERDSGELRLKPLVELNPRWTMGRVALQLEKRVCPGVPALWALVFVRELGARGLPAGPTEAARVLLDRYPPALDARGRLTSGIVLTSDPQRAREVMTFLAVGRSATAFSNP